VEPQESIEMPNAKPIPYADDVRPQDTEKALKTLTVSLVPNEIKPKAIDFGGRCPRCGDPFQHREWLVVVAAALKLNYLHMETLASGLDEIGIDRSHGDHTVDLTCSCDAAHPHRPKDKRGCGAHFRVRVTWAMAMAVKLEPPVGLPTAASAAEDNAWSTLVSTQLDDVRKTAENWRNGLVALVGAIIGFSMIKGPNDVSGLDYWAMNTVGLLLLAAFGCAISGTWSSLTAAFGSPSTMTRDAFHDQGGMDGYRLTLATDAATKLHCAQVATIITLVLLVGAVGLTWYGPRAKAVILDVGRLSSPNVCGTLLSSSNGYIDIKPSESEAVRLRMTDLATLTAVAKCP